MKTSIIAALRAGNSIENPTPYKWFGLACSIGGMVIVFVSGLAAARGWIDAAVSLSDAVLVVSLILGPLFAVSAHSAVVTTDRIGLPAASKRVQLDRVDGVPTDPNKGSKPPERSGIDDALGNFRGD